MTPEYEELFKTPVRFRIIEKRTRMLDDFVTSNRLNPIKSIECTPLPWCQRKRCFVNVEDQVIKRGGKIVTGWIFCEFENQLLETEAHAIWSDCEGRMHDITPHEFQPRRVLFSPDESVARIRGFTAPYKLILASDSRIRAIEEYDWEIEKLMAERFNGFGKEIRITREELDQLAEKIGVPLDVADHLITQRLNLNHEMADRYLQKDSTRSYAK